ncbi:MAG: hypothetical protein AAGC55_13380 [Myxococcota bacterium]
MTGGASTAFALIQFAVSERSSMPSGSMQSAAMFHNAKQRIGIQFAREIEND